MKWCALCGEPVNFDSAQGSILWHENQDGLRCYCPTTSNRDWKAAKRREEAEASGLRGKFAEALGHIDAALCYLGQVNKEYDPEQHSDVVPQRFYNSALDFWLQAELAEDSLKDILRRLQRVESFAPKEVEA